MTVWDYRTWWHLFRLFISFNLTKKKRKGRGHLGRGRFLLCCHGNTIGRNSTSGTFKKPGKLARYPNENLNSFQSLHQEIKKKKNRLLFNLKILFLKNQHLATKLLLLLSFSMKLSLCSIIAIFSICRHRSSTRVPRDNVTRRRSRNAALPLAAVLGQSSNGSMFLAYRRSCWVQLNEGGRLVVVGKNKKL